MAKTNLKPIIKDKVTDKNPPNTVKNPFIPHAHGIPLGSIRPNLLTAIGNGIPITKPSGKSIRVATNILMPIEDPRNRLNKLPLKVVSNAPYTTMLKNTQYQRPASSTRNFFVSKLPVPADTSSANITVA